MQMRLRTNLVAGIALAAGTVGLAGCADAQEDAEIVPFEPTSMVDYHRGYWQTQFQPSWAPVTITAINDLHVDAQTNRITVYAQARAMGRVIAPAQVGPGECNRTMRGTVCFHPDAVYLNGSVQELAEDDGSGAWWVKHSWVLGGEGYDNCELKPAETYDDCIYVEGALLEDGLTMKIGGETSTGAAVYNTRMPVLKPDEVSYVATRFGPKNLDPERGEIDNTLVVHGAITLTCQDEPSPLDGMIRACPSIEPRQ